MLTNQADLFGDVIHSYSRAEALADGDLVDVSDTAREAGIKFPTAVTRAVWDAYVEVPEGVTCQDVAGRLWDVVYMLRAAIATGGGGDTITYQLYVHNQTRQEFADSDLVTLKAICGPGDDAAPVITIMLPDED